MAAASDNPGHIMASAVDAEVAKFRELQEEVIKLRNDLQTVLSQETENEMVQQELDLLREDQTIYKKVGPVLLKQDLEEAQSTVKKRLEFIRTEKKKLETKIKDKETSGATLAAKIQQMQQQLQQTTIAATQAIAEHHRNSNK